MDNRYTNLQGWRDCRGMGFFFDRRASARWARRPRQAADDHRRADLAAGSARSGFSRSGRDVRGTEIPTHELSREQLVTRCAAGACGGPGSTGRCDDSWLWDGR
jgi:hypothetical protein